MINIKPPDCISFQHVSTGTTAIVSIFRGCDQNTKLDSRIFSFFFLSVESEKGSAL